MSITNHFKLPPTVHRKDGNPRLVGYELEFSGLTLEQTTKALKQSLGGETTQHSLAEWSLQVPELGKFNVEVDWDFLKRTANASSDIQKNQDWLEWLAETATLLVPIEVVCPPIPMNKLEQLLPITEALRNAGAVGTEESLLAAYGVHINTEIPELREETLYKYLQAFSLLQWWLVDAHNVNLARQISPYIDPYPEAYVQTVIEQPKLSMEQIFEEYLTFNPTRNRALDLLPLLAFIDEDKVRAKVDDSKINARPTFHYRLPNCHIDRTDWSLINSWNLWLLVEELACNEDHLRELRREFLNHRHPLIGVLRSEWVTFVEQWLKDQELV